MPTPIVLPKLGMTMEEATLVRWLKHSGDAVAKGDAVAEVETEKVTFEVEAPADGTLHVEAAEESVLQVGDQMGLVLAPGEAPAPATAPQSARAAAPPAPVPGPEAPVSSAAAVAASAVQEVRASPAARAAARASQVDLRAIPGTGPNGRIKQADVLGFVAGAAPAEPRVKASPLARQAAERLDVPLGAATGTGVSGRIMRADVERVAEQRAPRGPRREDRRVRLSSMRRTIARNMHQSLQDMAQLTLNMKVDVTEAVALRTRLIETWGTAGPRPTYTDMVVRAAALALVEHPHVNARIDGDELVECGSINIGLSVALDEGLVAPVLHDADALSLREIAERTKKLAAAAREKRLTPEMLAGGTFTVTTLGAWGVESFTPIINPPEAAILGVGAIETEAAFREGQAVPRQVMRLSLSFDHRVLDGAPAAAFLRQIRDVLEHPLLLGFA